MKEKFSCPIPFFIFDGLILFIIISNPGNGVPLVLLGAKSVASKVEKKLSILEEAEQTIQQQQ